MFEKFGYGFVLHQNYEQIRQQILNPDEPILASYGNLIPPDTMKEGIYFSQPNGFKCIIVVFKLRVYNRYELTAVLIPAPDVDCVQFYKDFAATYREGQLMISEARVQDINYLEHERYHLFEAYWKTYEMAMNKFIEQNQ